MLYIVNWYILLPNNYIDSCLESILRNEKNDLATYRREKKTNGFSESRVFQTSEENRLISLQSQYPIGKLLETNICVLR